MSETCTCPSIFCPLHGYGKECHCIMCKPREWKRHEGRWVYVGEPDGARPSSGDATGKESKDG